MKKKLLITLSLVLGLACISGCSKKEEEVTWSATQMKEYLKKQLPHVGVLGPAPCTIYKMSDIYRQRMTLKVTKTDHLYETLQMMMDYYNKKGKVNVICDFNPYTTI